MPPWATKVTERMEISPKVDFERVYKSTSEPQESKLSKKEQAVLKFTKIELHRLTLRIQEAESLSQADLKQLENQLLENDVL